MPLSSHTGLAGALSSRSLQAGFKYWLAVAPALALALGLGYWDPALAARTSMFAVLAVALSFHERVEATVESASAR